MRCTGLTLVALCCLAHLAGSAVGQAASPHGASMVLLEGYRAPDAPAPVVAAREAAVSTAQAGGFFGMMFKKDKHFHLPRRHRHHYPSYPVEDDGSVEDTLALFLECLVEARQLFNISNNATWPAAADAAVACFRQYLDVCIDLPKLPDHLALAIPGELFILTLDNLAATGVAGLQPAATVFQLYLKGGAPGGCSDRLAHALGLGCGLSRHQPGVLHSLAKVLVHLLREVLLKGIDNALGACAADVPAVLLSLASSYCPGVESGHPGMLVSPVRGVRSAPCLPAPGGSQYTNNPGVTLTGSALSLLVLSGDPQLQRLALQLNFAMNGMALAAAQASNYSDCLAGGKLAAALADVPALSGRFAGQAAATPRQLSADGQRVLCATISTLFFEAPWVGAPFPATNLPAPRSVLFQGALNVHNAIAAVATDPVLPPTPAPIKAELCAFIQATWTFNDTAAAPSVVYRLAPPPPPTPGSYSCVTAAPSDLPVCTNLPPWLPLRPEAVSSQDFLNGPYAVMCP